MTLHHRDYPKTQEDQQKRAEESVRETNEMLRLVSQYPDKCQWSPYYTPPKLVLTDPACWSEWKRGKWQAKYSSIAPSDDCIFAFGIVEPRTRKLEYLSNDEGPVILGRYGCGNCFDDYDRDWWCSEEILRDDYAETIKTEVLKRGFPIIAAKAAFEVAVAYKNEVLEKCGADIAFKTKVRQAFNEIADYEASADRTQLEAKYGTEVLQAAYTKLANSIY